MDEVQAKKEAAATRSFTFRAKTGCLSLEASRTSQSFPDHNGRASSAPMVRLTECRKHYNDLTCIIRAANTYDFIADTM